MNETAQDDKAKAHLEKMLEIIGVQATVSREELDASTICYRVNCQEDDARMLIGRRGQTLEAMQFLLRQMSRTSQAEDEYFIIDISDYRLRRKEATIERAKRGAVAVLNGEYEEYALPPMSAFERRIVHNYLHEEFPDLVSESRGFGEERHIVVKYGGGEAQAENPDTQES